jgi:hypothetical protein
VAVFISCFVQDREDAALCGGIHVLVLCRIVKTLPCVAVFMSSLTIVSIAIDRYRIIVHSGAKQVGETGVSNAPYRTLSRNSVFSSKSVPEFKEVNTCSKLVTGTGTKICFLFFCVYKNCCKQSLNDDYKISHVVNIRVGHVVIRIGAATQCRIGNTTLPK